MSAHTQQVSSAFTAPAPVQGAMAAARMGVTTATRLVVGQPEKLQGAAPMFETIGGQVSQLASQARSAASGIASWDGQARDAFNNKVERIGSQLDSLKPAFSQITQLLNQAANTSIQAANSIATLVRSVVTAVTTAYHTAKAAAIKTLGAALAKWLAWAIQQAARLLQMVIQMANTAAKILDAIGKTIDRVKEIARNAGERLLDLCRSLGLPEKARKLADVVLNKGKEIWESAEYKFSEDEEFRPGEGGRRGRWDEGSFGDHDDLKDYKPTSPDVKVDLMKGERNFGGHAEGELRGEHDLGDGNTISGSVKGEAGVLMADGSVYAGNKGIGAEGSVFSGVRGSADGSVSTLGGHASANAAASAEAGAGAKGNAAVGLDGAQVKAEAFAGAKAEGSVGGEVAGVGSTVKGEAWAGVGAEVDAKAKWDDGKLQLGLGVGAGVGVGGKVGAEITIEPAKTVDAVKSAGGAVVDYFKGK